MRSIRIILSCLILVSVMGVISGCGMFYNVESTTPEGWVRFIDVYIDGGNNFVLTGGLVPNGPVMVFPNDRVIINNMTNEKVVVALPASLFAKDERITADNTIEIEGNKRVILTVLEKGAIGGDLEARRPDGPPIDGKPNMKVGEEP